MSLAALQRFESAIPRPGGLIPLGSASLVTATPTKFEPIPWRRDRGAVATVLSFLAEQPEFWAVSVDGFDYSRQRRSLTSLHELGHTRAWSEADATEPVESKGLLSQFLLTPRPKKAAHAVIVKVGRKYRVVKLSPSPKQFVPVLWAASKAWFDEAQQRLVRQLRRAAAASQKFMAVLRAKARMRQSNIEPQIRIVDTPIEPMAPTGPQFS